jgi:hypothetical protein
VRGDTEAEKKRGREKERQTDRKNAERQRGQKNAARQTKYKDIAQYFANGRSLAKPVSNVPIKVSSSTSARSIN